ncbi:MAG: V-type ATP synthase subunit I [Candidatus Eremiobacteraeota bacterium]|nr:V-type ATP synthase subunit I [Candidatus Eremiobacteraeota bacterium]
MAISKLKKVYIIAPREDKTKILESLQKASLIHIERDLRPEIEEETKEKEVLTQHIELKIAKAEYIIDYLRPYEKKKSLAQHIEEGEKVVTYQKLKDIRKRCDLEKIYNDCYKLNREMRELETEDNDLKNRLTRLEPYKYLKVNFEEIHDTDNVRMKVGYIADATFKNFHLAIEDSTPQCTLYKIVEGYNRHDYLFISYLKQNEEEIEKILLKFNFREDDLKITGTVKDEIKQIEDRQDQIQGEKKGVEEESRLKADWLDRVKLYYDLLLTELEKKKTEEYLYETRETFIIKGWVKKENLGELKSFISNLTDCYEIKEMEPAKGEPVPIELRNAALVSPMEVITSMYSYPNYREFDPTPIYFFFFILFFGICLTDAGYGIILAVFSFAVLKILKARGQAAKLLKILIYGGIATIFTGLLTAGWFGIDMSALPPFLKNFVWFDPMKEALKFLSITLYLGIIETVWGYLVGTWLLVFKKKTDYATAIERFLWACLFSTGGPLLIMSGLLGQTPPEPWLQIMDMTVKISVVALFVLKFFETFRAMELPESIGGKILTVTITLFKAVIANAVGILKHMIDIGSNVLSYSRLMALGLATGQIAMAVNIIAGLAKSMIPEVLGVPFGELVAVVILIGGHLFNLALNTLGAMVHTARLQYVEFFPLFFEGGGKPFQPFSIKSKYNVVTNAEEAEMAA